jgi:hypothetical protein
MLPPVLRFRTRAVGFTEAKGVTVGLMLKIKSSMLIPSRMRLVSSSGSLISSPSLSV